MSKFNGPWAYYVEESIDHDLNGHERGDPFVSGYNIVDSEGNDVVGCEGILSDGEHYARLIAAAPSMLAALMEAIDCGMVPVTSAKEGGAATHSRQVKCADMIREAIKEATGESA